jgi:hypothetical protein
MSESLVFYNELLKKAASYKTAGAKAFRKIERYFQEDVK